MELHFTVGEGLVYAARGVTSPASRDMWTMTEDDFKVIIYFKFWTWFTNLVQFLHLVYLLNVYVVLKYLCFGFYNYAFESWIILEFWIFSPQQMQGRR